MKIFFDEAWLPVGAEPVVALYPFLLPEGEDDDGPTASRYDRWLARGPEVLERVSLELTAPITTLGTGTFITGRLCLYITGSNTFKVGFNNAFLHHENTTYSSPGRSRMATTSPRWLPTAITYRLVPRTVKVDVNRDMGFFVQDKWTTGRWTLSGAIRLRLVQEQLPGAGDCRHVLRTKSEHPGRQD